MEYINWLANNWVTILSVLTSVIGTFAAVAAITPNPTDDGIAKTLNNLLNILAANFGKAKNAE